MPESVLDRADGPSVGTSSSLGGDFKGGVALISPCGWGNIGDAAIMDSVIQAVRKRLPGTPILALTQNPSDTTDRHRIPAFTCSGFSRPFYGVVEHQPQGPFTAADVVATPTKRLRHRLTALPGIRGPWIAARLVRDDIRHRARLGPLVRGLSRIVVAGGGQLDDTWGGALGHPYTLWRWSRHARQTGARFLVLSVGTGSIRTAAARQFIRGALAGAVYVSFRDDGSRSLVGSADIRGTSVVPDLAYGLEIDMDDLGSSAGEGRPLTAISPIAFRDPRSWPDRDESRYRSYIGRLSLLVRRLLASGHDILFFATDGTDAASIDDLRQAMSTERSELLRRVSASDIVEHQQLLRVLRRTSAVVASRLHGVLLSHLVGVPVLALSYERKVTALMEAADMSDYCLGIDEFAPDFAAARLQQLVDDRAAVSERILADVDRCANLVNQQYDLVFGREG